MYTWHIVTCAVCYYDLKYLPRKNFWLFLEILQAWTPDYRRWPLLQIGIDQLELVVGRRYPASTPLRHVFATRRCVSWWDSPNSLQNNPLTNCHFLSSRVFITYWSIIFARFQETCTFDRIIKYTCPLPSSLTAADPHEVAPGLARATNRVDINGR